MTTAYTRTSTVDEFGVCNGKWGFIFLKKSILNLLTLQSALLPKSHKNLQPSL